MAAITRIFSGIQPTGSVHLGNYLGALRSWVRLQDQCSDVLYSIVDLHALTVPQAPIILRDNVRHIASCLLACGVDPERSVLFQQSAVPAHCELSWLLACRTSIGVLSRMTQWKVGVVTIHVTFCCDHVISRLRVQLTIRMLSSWDCLPTLCFKLPTFCCTSKPTPSSIFPSCFLLFSVNFVIAHLQFLLLTFIFRYHAFHKFGQCL